MLHLISTSAWAKPPIATDNPTQFFTNIATRLLKSELGLDLNHIQLYPTNQYTPAVHRLLQVTANLYDCITNRPISEYPHLPSVFRPLFAKTDSANGTVLFISGFTEVTDAAQMSDEAVAWHTISDVAAGEPIDENDMLYGVPLVIGVKKGLPNFNGLEMQTSVEVTRRLEFRRKLGDEGRLPNQTNQMFTLNVSNVFDLEAWNSYSNAYPRSLQMRAFVDMFASIWETNETIPPAVPLPGKLIYTNCVPALTPAPYINIQSSNWSGFVNPNYAQASFRVPFAAPANSFNYVSNNVYRSSTHTLEPLTGVFEIGQGFPVPHWYLHLRTRVRYYLIDTEVNRIVDFVNLDSQERPLDIAQILASDGTCGGTYVPNGSDGSMWCTNRLQPGNVNSPTFGILSQIGVGLGLVYPQNWNNFKTMSPIGLDRGGAIDFFRAQFGFSPMYYPGNPFSKTNVFYAPFAPTRTIYFRTSWQANDPLVHYTVPDLTGFSDWFATNRISFRNAWVTNGIGGVNKRYEPWGGNPLGGGGSSLTIVDPGCKDPMVTKSSDWTFPTNQTPSPGWLGQVHRGTPWQTLCLKSPGIGFGGWVKWLGAVDPRDADWMHPVRDRSVVSLLASLFNTNDERQLVSVNLASVQDYESALDGMLVYTNPAPSQMEPILLSSNSVQAITIATGIKNTQGMMPGGRFKNLGEVLATRELSLASPYVNQTNRYVTLTDLGYEALPSQLLSVLRSDPILTATNQNGFDHLLLTGMEGSDYILQSSSNLTDWVSLATNTLSCGSIDWALPDPQGSGPRFSRVMLQNP